ncbi:MAG: LTA synthase family protein [Bacteroidota bacterium]|nr:LTA synthase family protein [Bacteroidota bacterium]
MPLHIDVAGMKFISLILVLLSLFFIIRIFEYISISASHNLPSGSFGLELTGFLYDLVFIFQLSFIFLIPYLILFNIKKQLGTGFLIAVIFLLTIIYVSFSQYFINLLIPLGKDIFGYSKQEVIETVNASVEMNFSTFLPLILFIGLFIFLIWIFYKIEARRFVYITFWSISFLSVIFYGKLTPKPYNFVKDVEYFIVINKVNYLVYQSHEIYKEKRKDQFAYVNNYSNKGSSKSNLKEGIYNKINKEFPFLRYEDSTNTLGEYFEITDSNSPPNIVIIIVESLARAFSGPNAYLKSFTPFLDSLQKHSLYWENFLSTGGRTFAVFPALFASAPTSNKGFLELGVNMPDHLSMISLLKDNGYYSRFIYGGHSEFDNMNIFFKRQKIDRIIDENDFSSKYKRMPSTNSKMSWGYGDLEAYKFTLETLKNSRQPYLEIFMTLSLHDPFKILNQEKYYKQFERKLSRMKLFENEKNKYRTYKENYSCILYTDDALRYYFNEFKKRDDFNNTIFIITGDHRMIPIPHSSRIDRYHVPFFIYSPLLKKAEKFSSISTHRDLTPTLLSFLKFTYGLDFPNVVPWLSTGIDFTKQFRNVHSLPIMRTKNSIDDYLDGRYFLSNNILYSITPHFGLVPQNDPSKLVELKGKLREYKKVNKYACESNKIIPDSLIH